MPEPPHLVWDRSTKCWRDGTLVAGGSPWRLSRLAGSAARLADALSRAGRRGGVPAAGEDQAATLLVGRGLAHPAPSSRDGPHAVTAVVPAFGRPNELTATLDALRGLDVVVVDDGTPTPSPLREVAESVRVRYLRLEGNRGPAAARNAGIAATTTPLVALVDSDCVPEPGWLDRLVPFFDDPRVAVVAPRVTTASDDGSVLARFERSSSALDMGRRAALVRPGARLGFVPSATWLARRKALVDVAFDEQLRLGEDVDLVWRLADGGWLVRYEPSVVVGHQMRSGWLPWARRRFEYGTSAVALEARHPGRLSPVRISGWNAAAITLFAVGIGWAGTGVSAVAFGLLAHRLAAVDIPAWVAGSVLGQGLLADAAAIGQALRREWWPLGAVALMAAPWSRPARRLTLLMAAPLVAEWVRERPALDLVRYTSVRFIGDAAYGAGVLGASIIARDWAAVRPGLRRDGRFRGGGSST